MAMASPQASPGPALGNDLQEPLGFKGRPGYHVRVIGGVGAVEDPLASANGSGFAQEQ
jgi:hypothetical protein